MGPQFNCCQPSDRMTWWRRLFDSAALWRPGIEGWSGMQLKKWSRLFLNMSRSPWSAFLRTAGRILKSLQPLTLNPIPRGEGHICPPYHISAIFSGSTYPRRLQLYSKFKFCNYLTPKIGLVSEKFSYDPWEALKVGRVAHFLLRFCLKIDYNFTFTERRWSFLVEIEIKRPQKVKQKIKTYSQFSDRCSSCLTSSPGESQASTNGSLVLD